MGRHVKKHPWWAKAVIVLGMLAFGLMVFTVVITAIAASAPARHSAPLPAFTSDPSYPAAPSQPSPEPSAVTYYTIVSGDTLAAVSLKYCHTADWMSVAALNHIGNPGAITIGEKITC